MRLLRKIEEITRKDRIKNTVIVEGLKVRHIEDVVKENN